jgi:plasmid stabilization system protein ParE
VTYRLEFGPEAFTDVAEAFSWYEHQHPGLGPEFETELDRTLSLIVAMPAAGRLVYRTLRRALLRRFPFAIYYILGPDLIEVRGVLHTSRHPRAWRRPA